MKLKLITLSHKVPQWVHAGYEDYANRLRDNWHLELIDLSLPKRHKTHDIASLKRKEADRIRQALPKQPYIIALDERGKQIDTRQLSQQLLQWQQEQATLCFVIGGPDGLDADFLKQAQHTWSLSPLTFPHPLVRILVAEQLYRAYSLIKGHPYHRA